jgi:hypothetical protein
MKFDPNIDCGPVDFEISVNHHHQSSYKLALDLRNIITVSSSGSKNV